MEQNQSFSTASSTVEGATSPNTTTAPAVFNAEEYKPLVSRMFQARIKTPSVNLDTFRPADFKGTDEDWDSLTVNAEVEYQKARKNAFGEISTLVGSSKTLGYGWKDGVWSAKNLPSELKNAIASKVLIQFPNSYSSVAAFRQCWNASSVEELGEIIATNVGLQMQTKEERAKAWSGLSESERISMAKSIQEQYNVKNPVVPSDGENARIIVDYYTEAGQKFYEASLSACADDEESKVSFALSLMSDGKRTETLKNIVNSKGIDVAARVAESAYALKAYHDGNIFGVFASSTLEGIKEGIGAVGTVFTESGDNPERDLFAAINKYYISQGKPAPTVEQIQNLSEREFADMADKIGLFSHKFLSYNELAHLGENDFEFTGVINSLKNTFAEGYNQFAGKFAEAKGKEVAGKKFTDGSWMRYADMAGRSLGYMAPIVASGFIPGVGPGAAIGIGFAQGYDEYIDEIYANGDVTTTSEEMALGGSLYGAFYAGTNFFGGKVATYGVNYVKGLVGRSAAKSVVDFNKRGVFQFVKDSTNLDSKMFLAKWADGIAMRASAYAARALIREGSIAVGEGIQEASEDLARWAIAKSVSEYARDYKGKDYLQEKDIVDSMLESFKHGFILSGVQRGVFGGTREVLSGFGGTRSALNGEEILGGNNMFTATRDKLFSYVAYEQAFKARGEGFAERKGVFQLNKFANDFISGDEKARVELRKGEVYGKLTTEQQERIETLAHVKDQLSKEEVSDFTERVKYGRDVKGENGVRFTSEEADLAIKLFRAKSTLLNILAQKSELERELEAAESEDNKKLIQASLEASAMREGIIRKYIDGKNKELESLEGRSVKNSRLGPDSFSEAKLRESYKVANELGNEEAKAIAREIAEIYGVELDDSKPEGTAKPPTPAPEGTQGEPVENSDENKQVPETPLNSDEKSTNEEPVKISTPEPAYSDNEPQTRADATEKASSEGVSAEELPIERLAEKYEEKFGNVLSTDNAKLLFDGYNPHDVKSISSFHAKAGAIISKLFDYFLNTKKNAGDGSVVYTAGGVGSGKSTVVNSFKKTADFVMDSTMAGNIAYTRDGINKVLNNGQKAVLVYVYRDAKDAWYNGVLKRAKTSTGHVVSRKTFTSTHTKAYENFKKIVDEFGDKVEVKVFEVVDGVAPIQISLQDLETKRFYTEEELGDIYDGKIPDEARPEQNARADRPADSGRTGDAVPSDLRDEGGNRGMESENAGDGTSANADGQGAGIEDGSSAPDISGRRSSESEPERGTDKSAKANDSDNRELESSSPAREDSLPVADESGYDSVEPTRAEKPSLSAEETKKRVSQLRKKVAEVVEREYPDVVSEIDIVIWAEDLGLKITPSQCKAILFDALFGKNKKAINDLRKNGERGKAFFKAITDSVYAISFVKAESELDIVGKLVEAANYWNKLKTSTILHDEALSADGIELQNILLNFADGTPETLKIYIGALGALSTFRNEYKAKDSSWWDGTIKEDIPFVASAIGFYAKYPSEVNVADSVLGMIREIAKGDEESLIALRGYLAERSRAYDKTGTFDFDGSGASATVTAVVDKTSTVDATTESATSVPVNATQNAIAGAAEDLKRTEVKQRELSEKEAKNRIGEKFFKRSVLPFVFKSENPKERPALQGVLYEGGFITATNAKVLAHVRVPYEAEYEGKIIIAKTGEEYIPPPDFPGAGYPKVSHLLSLPDDAEFSRIFPEVANNVVSILKRIEKPKDKEIKRFVKISVGGREVFTEENSFGLLMGFAKETGSFDITIKGKDYPSLHFLNRETMDHALTNAITIIKGDKAEVTLEVDVGTGNVKIPDGIKVKREKTSTDKERESFYRNIIYPHMGKLKNDWYNTKNRVYYNDGFVYATDGSTRAIRTKIEYPESLEGKTVEFKSNEEIIDENSNLPPFPLSTIKVFEVDENESKSTLDVGAIAKAVESVKSNDNKSAISLKIGENELFFRAKLIKDVLRSVEYVGGEFDVFFDNKKIAHFVSSESGTHIVLSRIELSKPDEVIASFELEKSKSFLFNEKGEIKGSVSPEKRIESFGGEVIGNRDMWGAYRKTLSNITKEQLQSKTLSDVFPRPNAFGLVKSGNVSADVAALTLYIYNSIPPKPRYSEGYWLDSVLKASKIIQMLIEDKELAEKYLDNLRETAKKTQTVGKFTVQTSDSIRAENTILYVDTLKALGFPEKNVKLGKKRITVSHYVNKDSDTRYSHYVIRNGNSRVKGFDSFEKAVDALRSMVDSGKGKTRGEANIELKLFKDRVSKEIFIAVGNTSRYQKLKGGFKDWQTARAYIEENRASLEELYRRIKDIPSERNAENAERIGADWRKGKDVSEAQFAETFGFRGVRFGKWVEQDKRQEDLNDAFDALMDLADLLGVSPKALSLNGELALAFGALGHSDASAHYESGNKVINLTKKHGAGSLAHEWWHALDNYFGAMSGSGMSMITEARKLDEDNIRKEVAEVFFAVRDAIFNSKLAERSKALDGLSSGKPYWGTIVEMTARAFESWVKDTIDRDGRSNDYLANISSLDEWQQKRPKSDGVDFDDYPYPLPSEMESLGTLFRALADTIEERTGENGSVALYQMPTTEAMTISEADQRLLVKHVEGFVPGATVQIVDDVEAAAGEADKEARYQIAQEEQGAWNAILDKYEAGTLPQRGMNTVLERTPAVLQQCGANDLPIRISKTVLDKITKDKHSVPVSELRKLLTNIDNPIAVFRSRTQADSLVVLTEIKDAATGENAIVALRLDTKESGGGHEINAVASIYGKNPFAVSGMLEDGLAVYVNQKKTRAYLQSNRLQLPAEASKRGNPPLLTEEDFTNDELGVIKSKQISEMRDLNGVLGAYVPDTKQVFVAKNARVDTLLHELGWHATFHWAESNAPELYELMKRYASEAPAELKAKVAEVYGYRDGKISTEEFLDECGAALFSEQNRDLMESLLAQLQGRGVKVKARNWWKKFVEAVKAVWAKLVKSRSEEITGAEQDDKYADIARILSGNSDNPAGAMRELAQAFADGKALRAGTVPSGNASPLRERVGHKRVLFQRADDGAKEAMLTVPRDGAWRKWRDKISEIRSLKIIVRQGVHSANMEEARLIYQRAKEAAARKKVLKASTVTDDERKKNMAALGIEKLGSAEWGIEGWSKKVHDKLKKHFAGKEGVGDDYILELWKTIVVPSFDMAALKTLSKENVAVLAKLTEAIENAESFDEALKVAEDAESKLKNRAEEGLINEHRDQLLKLIGKYKGRWDSRQTKLNSQRKTQGLAEYYLHALATLNGYLERGDMESLERDIKNAEASLDSAASDEAKLQANMFLSAASDLENTPISDMSDEQVMSLLDKAETLFTEGVASLEAAQKEREEAVEASFGAIIKALYDAYEKTNGQVKEKSFRNFFRLGYSIRDKFDVLISSADPKFRAAAYMAAQDMALRMADCETKQGAILANDASAFLEAFAESCLTKKEQKEDRKLLSRVGRREKGRGMAEWRIERKYFIPIMMEKRDGSEAFSRYGRKLTNAQLLYQYLAISQREHDHLFKRATEKDIAEFDDEKKALYNRWKNKDALKDFLGKDFVELGNKLIEIMESHAEAIDKQSVRDTGLPLSYRRKGYFPIVRNLEKYMTDVAIQGKSPIIPKILIPRTHSSYDIDEEADVISVFRRHSFDVAHYITHGELNQELRLILESEKFKDFRKHIAVVGGEAFSEDLAKHLQDVISGRMAGSEYYNPSAKVMDKAIRLGRWIARVCALGLNVISGLKQVLGGMASFANDYGFINLFKAVMSNTGDMMANWEEIYESDGYQTRYPGMSLGRAMTTARLMNNDFVGNKLGKLLMWGVQVEQSLMFMTANGDKVPLFLVGSSLYGALKEQYYANGKTREEAKALAMADFWERVDRCQQARMVHNTDSISRGNHEYKKAFVQFLTAPLQFATAEIKALETLVNTGGEKQAWNQFVNVATHNHIVEPALMLAAAFVAYGMSDDDEFDWERNLQPFLFGSMDSIPLIGGAAEFLLSDQYKTTAWSTAAFEFPTNIMRRAKSAVKTLWDGEEDTTRPAINKVFRTVTIIRQVEDIYDKIDEEE